MSQVRTLPSSIGNAYLSIKAMIMFFTFTFWCNSAQARRKGFKVWRWNSSGKTWNSNNNWLIQVKVFHIIFWAYGKGHICENNRFNLIQLNSNALLLSLFKHKARQKYSNNQSTSTIKLMRTRGHENYPFLHFGGKKHQYKDQVISKRKSLLRPAYILSRFFSKQWKLMKNKMSPLKKWNVLTYLNNTFHEIFLSQSISTIHNLLQYPSQNNLKEKELKKNNIIFQS